MLSSESGPVLLVETSLVVAFDWGENIIGTCSSLCIESLYDGKEVTWPDITRSWC